MILNSTQNLEIDGELFDKVALSLNMAISPTNKTVVNILFTPMRLDEDGRVVMAPCEHAKPFRVADLDAFAIEHPDVSMLLSPIAQALQNLVNETGA